ncbi:MAG: hypothetical protein RIS76_3894 [Verrucomicrobiota bacterium]
MEWDFELFMHRPSDTLHPCRLPDPAQPSTPLQFPRRRGAAWFNRRSTDVPHLLEICHPGGRAGVDLCLGNSHRNRPYYGTEDQYLRSRVRLLKPGGQLGIAGAALLQEMEGPVPDSLRGSWPPEMRCMHSADWWRRHWEDSGVMNIEVADNLPEGCRRWREWHRAVAPDNTPEIQALDADQGRHLGCLRAIARRREISIEESVSSFPRNYTKKPLLRTDKDSEG